jgi:hypothetical protein
MTFVEDTVHPPSVLEPSILGDVRFVCSNHNIEVLAASKGVFEAFTFGDRTVKANDPEGR